MSKVIHTFFDIHMGLGFQGLGDILNKKIKRELTANECAVFINTKWSAAKILFPNNVMIYWRTGKTDGITYDELRALPGKVSKGLEFKQAEERSIIGRVA